MPEPVTVIVSDEMGYQYFLWQPDMGGKELIRWWQSLEELPRPPHHAVELLDMLSFPGWIHRIYPVDSQNRRWSGRTPTSSLRRLISFGLDIASTAIEDPTRFLIERNGSWAEFRTPDGAWYLHTHMPYDSFLEGPEGSIRYLHKGYIPWEEYSRE